MYGIYVWLANLSDASVKYNDVYFEWESRPRVYFSNIACAYFAPYIPICTYLLFLCAKNSTSQFDTSMFAFGMTFSACLL